MADGQIFGTLRKWGHAAHIDGAATTVLSWTVPAIPDAYYLARIVAMTTSATGTESARWAQNCIVRVDDLTGILVSPLSTGDVTTGATGYVLTASIAAGALEIAVAAAINHRTTVLLEVFGHEQAIVAS